MFNEALVLVRESFVVAVVFFIFFFSFLVSVIFVIAARCDVGSSLRTSIETCRSFF